MKGDKPQTSSSNRNNREIRENKELRSYFFNKPYINEYRKTKNEHKVEHIL